MTRLVVVGQGYVGLPLALRAVDVGFDVVGLEQSSRIVRDLNSGLSHVDDIVAEDLLAAILSGYRASTDPRVLSRADVIVVCVPTPLSSDGGVDLGAVESAADLIGQHVSPGTLCILESTTYPGTTEEIFAPKVCSRGLVPGRDLFVAFSPERIDPGNPTFGIKNTPKVVGGMTPACTVAAVNFYELLVDTVVEARGAREAELSKLLENTFRHVNIALVNEMVRFSQELKIDLWNAIDCAETKPFGFMAFRPGPGVGGHCIPVDPTYLSHRVKAKLGYAFRMVEMAEEINSAAPAYVASRIWRLLNEAGKPARGAKVLILGVTYKANIADRRESPADPIALKLTEWGADVAYHDPFVPAWRPRGGDDTLACVDDPYVAAGNSDAVALLQCHSYYNLERLASESLCLLDTRGVLPESAIVTRL